MIQMPGEFQVRLTGIIFVLYTALPDEALVEVFKNFCIKENLKTYIVPGLKKVEAYCKR